MSTTIDLLDQLKEEKSKQEESANKACLPPSASEKDNQQIITNNFEQALLAAINTKTNFFQFNGLGDAKFSGKLNFKKNKLAQVVISNNEMTKGDFAKFPVYLSSWQGVIDKNFFGTHLQYLAPSYSFWNGSGTPPPAYNHNIISENSNTTLQKGIKP